MAQFIPLPVRDFFSDLATKNYEKDYVNANMTAEEIVQAKQDRASKYLNIILLCITSLFWADLKAMLKELYGIDHCIAYRCTLYFVFALVSMLLGVTASSLTSSAPCYMGFSGNGALQGIIFVLVGFHIETLVYHPNLLYAIICLAVTVSIVIFYWGASAQDPVWLHFLVKLIWKLPILLCNCIGFLVRSIWESGQSIFVAALARPPRGYQPAGTGP